MNKEELIALGLTEEQADKVVGKYENMIPKARFNEVNEAKKLLEQSISEKEKKLQELTATTIDGEELKKQLSELQKEAQAKEEEMKANLQNLKIDSAIELALTKAGAKNNKAVRSLLDMERIVFKDDKLTGLEEQIKEVQEKETYLFKNSDNQGVVGGSPKTTPDNIPKDVTLENALSKYYNK